HEWRVGPWDGPAALAFSDGVCVGSALDRNGLRPCRYKITRDGLVVAGSESGLVDLNASEVVESGRLGPGELLVVDTRRKAILRNAGAKREVARRRPYSRWAAPAIRLPRPAAAPAGARGGGRARGGAGPPVAPAGEGGGGRAGASGGRGRSGGPGGPPGGGGGGGGRGGGPDALRGALDGLCRSAGHAVQEGA